MPYFTTEQIAKAREMDLLTYLKNYNPDELQYDSRDTFCTRTHDSLKINNGLWYWFSRGFGGKSALDYLIKVEEFSFTEAVEHLIKQKGLEKKVFNPQKIITKEERIAKFRLPKNAPNSDRAISYLRSRGISKNIIEECINKRCIYQDYENNNVVFIGYDENNIPRYAGMRGTTPKKFMQEVYGSDKNYSFKLKSETENNTVHLFECPIDLLSYATLKELKNEPWYEENLLSLAGIYKPAKKIEESKVPSTLSNYLEKNPNTNTIFVHFDNDIAGRLATKVIQNRLSDSYKIIDEPPENGKDFNDCLCNYLGINHQKNYENCR